MSMALPTEPEEVGPADLGPDGHSVGDGQRCTVDAERRRVAFGVEAARPRLALVSELQHRRRRHRGFQTPNDSPRSLFKSIEAIGRTVPEPTSSECLTASECQLWENSMSSTRMDANTRMDQDSGGPCRVRRGRRRPCSSVRRRKQRSRRWRHGAGNCTFEVAGRQLTVRSRQGRRSSADGGAGIQTVGVRLADASEDRVGVAAEHPVSGPGRSPVPS